MAMMDAEGNVPLEVAARFGNENMCKILLDHVKNKLPENEIYRFVRQAAHEASEAGHLEILKLIIWSGFKTHETQRILQLRNEYAYTCLHLAAAGGNIQTFCFSCQFHLREVIHHNRSRENR